MDIGRCRVCGRPFTSGEVTGVGILRPRHAEHGGPLVEFACPTCRAVTRLVPHGQGRYAPPGQPPPPPPTEEERRVPWRRATADAAAAARVETHQTSTSASAGEPTAASARGRAATPAGGAGASPGDSSDGAISLDEALTLLGVSIGADATTIDEAFHRLALMCHPDKVAHLDPDFVALAERKFRRLQAARSLLLNE